MYVIECIVKDPPYISIGYVGTQGKFVRSFCDAMRFRSEDDVRKACGYIREKYIGREFFHLMPWVFGVTDDGRQGKRIFELEK